VVHEGDVESSTLVSVVSRIVEAHHHAHTRMLEPGSDHFPEAGDGELVDENLNKSIRKTRAIYVPRKKRAIAIRMSCTPLRPTDGLWVHTEQWT